MGGATALPAPPHPRRGAGACVGGGVLSLRAARPSSAPAACGLTCLRFPGVSASRAAMADAWEEIRRLAADFQRAQFAEATQRCPTLPLLAGVRSSPWASAPRSEAAIPCLDPGPSQPVPPPRAGTVGPWAALGGEARNLLRPRAPLRTPAMAPPPTSSAPLDPSRHQATSLRAPYALPDRE